MNWLKGYRIAEEVSLKKGYYDEMKNFRMDKNFVLIRINNGNVELAVVNGKPVEVDGKKVYEITHIITGDKPQDIYWELVKESLIELPDHFAYVGKELHKAFSCRKNGWRYKQS